MGSIAPLLCWQPPRIVLGDYCAQYAPSCLCAQCFLMRDSRETLPTSLLLSSLWKNDLRCYFSQSLFLHTDVPMQCTKRTCQQGTLCT